MFGSAFSAWMPPKGFSAEDQDFSAHTRAELETLLRKSHHHVKCLKGRNEKLESLVDNTECLFNSIVPVAFANGASRKKHEAPHSPRRQIHEAEALEPLRP